MATDANKPKSGQEQDTTSTWPSESSDKSVRKPLYVAAVGLKKHALNADGTLVEVFQRSLDILFYRVSRHARQNKVEFYTACKLGARVDYLFQIVGQPGPWDMIKNRVKRARGFLRIPKKSARDLSRICYKMLRQTKLRVLRLEHLAMFTDVFRPLMQPFVSQFLSGTLRFIITPEIVAGQANELTVEQQATLASALAKADVLLAKNAGTVATLVELGETINDVLASADKPELLLLPREHRLDERQHYGEVSMSILLERYLDALRADELDDVSLIDFVWYLNGEMRRPQ